MKVFAIDQGNTESAYCIVDAETLRPVEFAKLPNAELRKRIKEIRFDECDRAALYCMQGIADTFTEVTI